MIILCCRYSQATFSDVFAGGKQALLNFAGKDATENIEFHSNKMLKIAKPYCIGYVKGRGSGYCVISWTQYSLWYCIHLLWFISIQHNIVFLPSFACILLENNEKTTTNLQSLLCMCIYVCGCMYICVCLYVCMCTYACMCVVLQCMNIGWVVCDCIIVHLADFTITNIPRIK